MLPFLFDCRQLESSQGFVQRVRLGETREFPPCLHFVAFLEDTEGTTVLQNRNVDLMIFVMFTRKTDNQRASFYLIGPIQPLFF